MRLKLNTDDTEMQQMSNYLDYQRADRDNLRLVNCEKCCRLFYIPQKTGVAMFEEHKLFCSRCRKEAIK